MGESEQKWVKSETKQEEIDRIGRNISDLINQQEVRQDYHTQEKKWEEDMLRKQEEELEQARREE